MDDHAFGCQLVDARRKLLTTVRRRMMLSREAAEDVVQETLVRAWQSRNSYGEQDNMFGWLLVIAYNTYRSHYRKQKRMVYLDDMGKMMPNKADSYCAENLLYAKQVMAAMATITPAYQAALRLAAEGHGTDEIAEELHIPYGTAKSRLSRGRQKLLEMVA